MSSKSYRFSHISKDNVKKYDKIYGRDYYDSRVWVLEKKILKLILNKYLKIKIKSYLDFACGTGRILEFFEKRVNLSFGIDLSESMLNEAKKKFKKTTFIKADITKEQNIFNHKFDVVTAFRFFLNAETTLREKVLKEIYKILNDQGLFIFNIHGNKYSTIYLFKKKNHCNTLTLSEMKKLLKKYSFKVIKVYGLSFLPWDFAFYFPKRIWLLAENLFSKIKLINKFGSNLIIICKKNNSE